MSESRWERYRDVSVGDVFVSGPVVQCRSSFRHFFTKNSFWRCSLAQSEKFLDLGTVTRPPSSIYARVNCSVIRDWCTRVQGIRETCFDDHAISGFRRLSTTPDHTTPAYSGIRRQTYLFKCSSETSQGHISETTRWIFFFKRWKFR